MKTRLLALLFSVIAITTAEAQLSLLRHFINDTLIADTILYQGAPSGETTAWVTIQAKPGITIPHERDLLIQSDFSISMKDNAKDTAVPKILLVKDALRNFITNKLTNKDKLVLGRFSYGCQFFPEKDRSMNRLVIPEGTDLPKDSVYADTIYYIPKVIGSHLDSVCIASSTGGNTYVLNLNSSYGIEKLWWQFTHSVRVGHNATYAIDTLDAQPIEGSGFFTQWNITVNPLDVRLALYPNQPNYSLAANQSSIYFTLWQSMRYSLSYASQPPVIVLITDGEDQSSVDAFKMYQRYYPGVVPSCFDSTLLAGSILNLRTQFYRYMIDSVRNQASLFIVLMDTSLRPDYSNLFMCANQGTIDKGHFYKLGGKNLKEILSFVNETSYQATVQSVGGVPVFVDELNKSQGVHYVSTLTPSGKPIGGSNNTVSVEQALDSIVVDSSGTKTLIKFYFDPTYVLDKNSFFEYKYPIRVSIAPSYFPQQVVLNPDSALSRAYFRNAGDDITSYYFNKDTIYVLSQSEGLELSRQPGFLDTTGISFSRRELKYSIEKPVIDTALTFYSLLKIRASTGVTFQNVAANWSFSPTTWLDDGSRSISLSNAYSARPYVIIHYDASGANSTNYSLSATFPSLGQPQVLFSTSLTYMASVVSSGDYIDSIALSSVPSPSLDISNRYCVSGTIEQLKALGPITLYAVGRSHLTGAWNGINVSWNMTSGFDSYYQALKYDLPLSGNASSYATLRIGKWVDEDIPVGQTDSGVITITSCDTIGNVPVIRNFSLVLSILDLTTLTRPNLFGLFTKDAYLRFQNDPAKIESLFVNYFDTLRTLQVAPGDTELTLYSLLFYRNPSTPNLIKYLGLDATAEWRASSTTIPGLNRVSLSSSTFRYVNYFAPCTDIIQVTSSMDSIRVLNINWNYGLKRFLSLEPKDGLPNDNINGMPYTKDNVVLDPHITTDTVFAVIRDEFGNRIPYMDTIAWTCPNIGYSNYLSFSGRTPCVIKKIKDGNMLYYLFASIPSGVQIAGMTLSTPIKDSLFIRITSTTIESENTLKKPLTFEVFPSPFASAINILFPNPEASADIDIFDVHGKRVMHSKHFSGNNVSWRPVNLTSGVYLIKVCTQSKVFKKRVLFQK